MEIYKTLFETWRSQVNSYWQRSNYFAVFETAALAGCWSLMEHGHLWMGLFGAGLGICLTIVWWSSNSTVHSYVVYWWEAIKAIEHKLLLQNDGLDFVSRHSGSGRWPRYSHLVQIVPVVFMVAWIGLLGYRINSLDNFVWAHADVATAWFTLFAALFALIIGIPTVFYLLKYVRLTAGLRVEAQQQTVIRGDAYEATVMPLLVAEFGSWKLSDSLSPDAVVLRKIGKGPALGVQFAPLRTATSTVIFDYIALIEPGGTVPLACVGDTPAPPDYPTPEQSRDERQRLFERLYGYARWYVLKFPDTYELKVETRSLSNTVHEFLFNLELRGTDRFAVLVYRGRNSKPGPKRRHLAVDA
jgi:hypothetical protein